MDTLGYLTHAFQTGLLTPFRRRWAIMRDISSGVYADVAEILAAYR